MAKVLLLYTSLTGNTELMAESMLDELKGRNMELDVKLFDDFDIAVPDLLHYDVIFIGIYTWVGGDVPLDVEDFFDALYKIDLSGRVFGVFGSADSDYPDYGTAAIMMHEQLAKLGGTMIPDLIISDLDPTEEEITRCKQMVNTAFELLDTAK